MVTDTTPRDGTALRIARGLGFLVAATLVVGAVYYLLVPAQVASNEGVFGCGTAANPPTDGFAQGACQGTATINLYRTFALAAIALLIGIGSYLLFREPLEDDWEDEDESADARGDRRSTPVTRERRTALDERDGGGPGAGSRRHGGAGRERTRPPRGQRRPERDDLDDLDDGEADASPARGEGRGHERVRRPLRGPDRARPAAEADDWEQADRGRGRGDDDLFGDEPEGRERPARRSRDDDF